MCRRTLGDIGGSQLALGKTIHVIIISQKKKGRKTGTFNAARVHVQVWKTPLTQTWLNCSIM